LDSRAAARAAFRVAAGDVVLAGPAGIGKSLQIAGAGVQFSRMVGTLEERKIKEAQE